MVRGLSSNSWTSRKLAIFEIKCRQPSGKWGTQAAFALLHEAYVRQHAPALLACARPQQMIRAGESAVLDGSGSWSADGDIVCYDWQFTDGGTATGPRVTRGYDQPGRYCEILKITKVRLAPLPPHRTGCRECVETVPLT